MRIRPAGLIAGVALAFGFMSSSAISSRVSANLPGGSGYHVVKTIPIGGEGLWDYCIVDSVARRVYISHFTHVVVLNADTGAIVGDIPDTQGVHGIALAPALGLGFTSNGRANTVTIFDLKSLKAIRTVETGGENPDAIFYDAATEQVFAFNGRTQNATAIEPESGKVAATFAMGGKPEFAAGDGNGHVFVNIEDKSEIVEIDAQKRVITNRWPLSPCKEPSGLAMDKKNRRLFAVCDNNIMAVLNADSGKVVATPAIGDDPDAAGFDPKTQFAFSSNGGSGNLTVIHEDSPDHYSVVENVPTRKYARTMAIDFNTQNIFLPIAQFEAITPQGAKRPPIKQGTFGVLLVSK
ncbi:MAG: YncE family protein [Candidatus Acidiferrales bacterium]